jgi:hypothetical protein
MPGTPVPEGKSGLCLVKVPDASSVPGTPGQDGNLRLCLVEVPVPGPLVPDDSGRPQKVAPGKQTMVSIHKKLLILDFFDANPDISSRQREQDTLKKVPESVSIASQIWRWRKGAVEQHWRSLDIACQKK